jgi:hypothetical protein
MMVLNIRNVPPIEEVDGYLDTMTEKHAPSTSMLPLFICSSEWVIVRNYQ